MKTLKRYTDWYGWWIGLRQNLLKCIGTTGVAWFGTNFATTIHIPIEGLNWKQAGTMFLAHIIFEICTYLKDHQPTVVEEGEAADDAITQPPKSN